VTTISAIGTYLPTWGSTRARQAGDDEDAVTLAVAAGRAALGVSEPTVIRRVVLISRDLPLLEGDNGAPLLAGLGLGDDLPVRETIGGAPAALDAVVEASDATLVIGVDVTGSAGASAVLCGGDGAAITVAGRVVRSLPVSSRDTAGNTSDYADPRLLRELGVNESLARLGNPKPVAVAGLGPRESAAICIGSPAPLPTVGASSLGFALAALAEQDTSGLLLAAEQATLTLAELGPGRIAVVRDEREPQPRPKGTRAAGSSVSISLPAYERAFDAKLRLAAARCRSCGTLSYPPRYRCLECGAEGGLGVSTDLVPLPRRGEAYSLSTVHVPVPGLISPYTIVIVELGDTGVRSLVRLTGAPPDSVTIGDAGTMVFRLVAVRQGVPDYGYAFLPDRIAADEQGAA
jgi:uncharacterized OB-fold protein